MDGLVIRVSFSSHNLIALLLLAATAQDVVRQDAERERLETSLKRYHVLIDAYRDGDDKAVTEIVAWERKRLTDIINAAQTPADVLRPWDQARFKAAAMLHTDAAIRAIESDDTLAAFQLQLASRLLFTGGPDVRAFARTWYVTVARVLRDRARPLIAEALLERARQHLPGDAVVLYESAVLQELIATFSAFVTETIVPGRPFAGSPAEDIRNLDNTRAAQQDSRLKAWRADTDNAARWLNEALKAESRERARPIAPRSRERAARQPRRRVAAAPTAGRFCRRRQHQLPRIDVPRSDARPARALRRRRTHVSAGHRAGAIGAKCVHRAQPASAEARSRQRVSRSGHDHAATRRRGENGAVVVVSGGFD